MTSDDILARLSSIVADETSSQPELTSTTVADDIPGWDSVTHSRIILRVEEAFAIAIDVERTYEFADVGELVEHIEERLGAPADAPTDPVDASQGKGGKVAGARGALFSNARYPAPYSMFHDKPGTGGSDANGFLNREAPVTPKPAGEKRVLMFGNSAVRHGEPDQGVSTHLERLFHAAGRPEVRVYNFGIVSGNCAQSLMYLVHQGVDMTPDLVITYDGYVDLTVPYNYDPRPGYPYNQYLLELVHEQLGAGTIGAFDLERAELERLRQLRDQCGWSSPEWEDAIAQTYVTTIRKVHEIARSCGAKTYSCLQPALASKIARVGSETQWTQGARRQAFLTRTLAAGRAAFDQLAGRLDPEWSRFGDLSAIFADSPEACFIDAVHLDIERHPAVAQRLFAEIEGMI